MLQDCPEKNIGVMDCVLYFHICLNDNVKGDGGMSRRLIPEQYGAIK